MFDPYKILGIKKTASNEAIKKAYRKKSMKCHPDQGGDAEEFARLNKAYKILIDDEKRQKFDQGGSVDDILKSSSNKDQKSQEIIVGLFVKIISMVDPVSSNIILLMNSELDNVIEKIPQAQAQDKAMKEKLIEASKRVKSKNSFLKDFIENQIKLIEANKIKFDKQKEEFLAAKEYLKQFSYDHEFNQLFRISFSSTSI